LAEIPSASAIFNLVGELVVDERLADGPPDSSGPAAEAIDLSVIAVTAGAALLRHRRRMTPGMPRPDQGGLIMLATVSFTLLALAIATPGLVTLAMSGLIDVQ
jgi:hypothetical protein